jgi:predicted metallo-beta-lactamase superfamily hydrolase
MLLEVNEVDQGAVHVHYDHHVPMYQDKYIEYKRVLRHIILISNLSRG